MFTNERSNLFIFGLKWTTEKLKLRFNFKNGRIRSLVMFPSFFIEEIKFLSMFQYSFKFNLLFHFFSALLMYMVVQCSISYFHVSSTLWGLLRAEWFQWFKEGVNLIFHRTMGLTVHLIWKILSQQLPLFKRKKVYGPTISAFFNYQINRNHFPLKSLRAKTIKLCERGTTCYNFLWTFSSKWLFFYIFTNSRHHFHTINIWKCIS